MDAKGRSPCPVCGGVLSGRRKVYCRGRCRLDAAMARRHAVDPSPEAETDRGLVMEAVRRTGMTRSVAQLAVDLEREDRESVRRRLRELLAAGDLGKIGSRYFPRSWVGSASGFDRPTRPKVRQEVMFAA